jgi:hypothetical protein
MSRDKITIEITPEMCAAGIEALDRNEGVPIGSEHLVAEVFAAMARAQRSVELEIVEMASYLEI